jgi:hypothetical protein
LKPVALCGALAINRKPGVAIGRIERFARCRSQVEELSVTGAFVRRRPILPGFVFSAPGSPAPRTRKALILVLPADCIEIGGDLERRVQRLSVEVPLRELVKLDEESDVAGGSHLTGDDACIRESLAHWGHPS